MLTRKKPKVGGDFTTEIASIQAQQLPRMARIHQLPEALVDQIAAGEVVERPASVVKELVENSLDAGARRIRVEARDGGIGSLTITDDGEGMSPGDARLALQRHATSKLACADDLERIHSFGFRGEALPAIASVSRLRLRTRARGAAEAIELRIEAGKIVQDRAVGGPEGTRIEVADLFAPVPARRKFLKRPTTEWGHIADWLARLALAMPPIHFDVQRDDRPAWTWPATDRPLDRIAAVLSEAEARHLVPVLQEERAGHLEAYVSPPEHTRANANSIYLFVNGRAVRDRMLRHALLDVYRDWLPRGRFPSAVLYLTVPPESVDVNVHPAKLEVRFRDPQAIHALVRHALHAAIGERRWLAEPVTAADGRVDARPMRGRASAVAEPAISDWILAQRQPAVSESEDASAVAAGERDAEASANPPRLAFGALRRVGQLLATYLIVEGKDGAILVDQHAAHERILYERMRAEWLEHGVARQGLLAPVHVELAPATAAALADAGDTLERLGFEAEPFGESAFVVRALPAMLSGRDPAGLLRSLADEIAAGEGVARSGSTTRLLSAADRTFASLACHSARRAGDHLEPAEQQSILDGLDAIPWAPTCPHGRPVAVALDRAEIERRFGRR